MDSHFSQLKVKVYDKCAFEISNFKLSSESKAYGACQFELNGRSIISRNAKITPKKVGQFVTFWNRSKDGLIEPYNKLDHLDFYIVNVCAKNQFGQFVFPKSVLINKGIISSEEKEGKRAFRVYPSWEKNLNKQAERNQNWQLEYFYEINATTNIEKVLELYQVE
jgi:hypothetical protein